MESSGAAVSEPTRWITTQMPDTGRTVSVAGRMIRPDTTLGRVSRRCGDADVSDRAAIWVSARVARAVCARATGDTLTTATSAASAVTNTATRRRPLVVTAVAFGPVVPAAFTFGVGTLQPCAGSFIGAGS